MFGGSRARRAQYCKLRKLFIQLKSDFGRSGINVRKKGN